MARILKITNGVQWLRVPDEGLNGNALLMLDREEQDFLFNLLDFVAIFASEGKPGYEHMENIRVALAGGSNDNG